VNDRKPLLAGLEEVRRMQGQSAGGMSEDTRFPDRAARQMLESIWGDRQAPLTRLEFKQMVGQCRLTASKPVLKVPMLSALETRT